MVDAASFPRELGDHETVRLLGQGAMGYVLEVRSRATGASYAAKIMKAGSPTARDRFRREAELLARCDRHPGIVKVHQFGETSEGGLYMIMDLVLGESLDQVLAREGKLDPLRAARLGREIAAALGHAHSLGIVHRDVKPSNVLLDAAGVHVTDFGLATACDLERLTRTGTLLGTPLYTAPEQVEGGGAVGPPADVFALGCLLFEALTGSPPLEGSPDLGNLLAGLLSTRPLPRVTDSQPACPHELDAIVARALAKDPEQRYSSGAELALALDEFLAARMLAAKPRVGRRLVAPLAITGLLVGGVAVALAVSPKGRAPSERRTAFLEADAAFERSAWAEAASRYDQARSRLSPAEAAPEACLRRQAAAHVLAGGERTAVVLAAFPREALEEPPLSLACGALYARALRRPDVAHELQELNRFPVPRDMRRVVAAAWLRIGASVGAEIENGLRPAQDADGIATAAKPLIEALVRARELDPSIGPYPEILEPALALVRKKCIDLVAWDLRGVPRKKDDEAAMAGLFERYPDHPLYLWLLEFRTFVAKNPAMRERVLEGFLVQAASLHPPPLEIRSMAHDIATARPDIASPETPAELAWLRRLAALSDDKDTWLVLARALKDTDGAGADEARRKADKAETLDTLLDRRVRAKGE